MQNYMIVRHGSNSANQSMCDRMPVAIVEAPSADRAIEVAITHGIHCYANQHLSAVASSIVDPEEWNALLEESTRREEHGEPGLCFSE